MNLGHAGVILGSFWHCFGTNDFHQNVAAQIFASESRSRAIRQGDRYGFSRSLCAEPPGLHKFETELRLMSWLFPKGTSVANS